MAVVAQKLSRASVATLAGLLAFGSVQGAGAESAPPTCSSYDLVQVAPRTDGLTIPANAPALAVDYSPIWTVELELVGPDGGAIAFNIETDPYPYANGARLVRFESPLAEGKGYELRWTQTCLNSYPGTMQLKGVRSFDVGPAVAWPSPSGTIETVVDGSGKITSNVKFSPEAQAFLPIASIRLDTTKGGGIASHDYGEFTAPILKYAPDLQCSGNGTTVDAFSLNLHVAGFAADPDTVSVPFHCECSPVPEPDGGTVIFDGGSSQPSDAKPLEDGPDGIWDAKPSVAGSGGCSARGNGRRGGAAWVSIGIVAWGIALSRRFRRGPGWPG